MIRANHAKAVDRRTRLLAFFLGVPVILCALGVSLIETWRWMRPDSPLFVPPVPGSMADAIARDEVRAVYDFIRGGQDPNQPIAVRHPVFTGGRRVEIAPLLWAVATGSDQTVAMLLAFGARPDPATHGQAICLAEQLKRADIVRLLQLSGPKAPPCPAGQDHIVLPLASSR